MGKKKIIIICGPTAVGKTSLGVELCKKLNGEIISADSQQVYRGMDIGTAKDDLTGTGVVCHLVDVVNPDEAFDAVKFAEMADTAIADISGREKVPIVVGGTGFYIRVLMNGLCEAPARDENIRAELLATKLKDGAGALYEILKNEDPAIAKKIHKNNFPRIMRAIEVKRLTGRSLSDLQAAVALTPRYDALKIGLNIERAELYKRINERVDKMITNGLISEVEGLVAKYGPDIQSLKAVGYKEFVQYIKKELSLETATTLTKQNTRHFAKRQLTWFNADKEIVWYQPDERELIVEAVTKF